MRPCRAKCICETLRPSDPLGTPFPFALAASASRLWTQSSRSAIKPPIEATLHASRDSRRVFESELWHRGEGAATYGGTPAASFKPASLAPSAERDPAEESTVCADHPAAAIPCRGRRHI